MNRRIFSILIYTIVILLTIVPRVYRINSLPPSLFADEVDASYQAKFFNKNQSDYFGNRFPTHFHSFSDWRTPLYIYSVALFQRLPVSDDLATRLPSATFGIISVYILFLITKSLPATFLFAISPWAIHYSRTGFEVSGMILCLLLSIYFWQKHHQSQNYQHILLSTLFICISPYFYSTAKLFIIFLGFLLIYIYPLKLKQIIIASFFGLIILSPLAVDTFKGRSGYRFSYISIFTEPHREQITDMLRYQDILLSHPDEIGVPTPPLSFLYHNKYQLIFQKFITNYLSSFSPDFLFLTGDRNVRQGFGQHGLLYSLDFLLLLFGLAIYIKYPTKLGKLFLWMLFLAPVPFALTRDSDTAHATRLILMLPSIIYFTSLTLSKKLLLVPIYILLFINFWHYYQNHYPQDSARSWHANLKEAVDYSSSYSNSKIYFSDKSEPFMPFFLNYFPYLPTDSISNHLTKIDDHFFNGQCLDKQYCFGQFKSTSYTDNNTPTLLIVSSAESFSPPPGFAIQKTLTKKYQNSETYLVYSNKQ